jgi:hypothetical protein
MKSLKAHYSQLLAIGVAVSFFMIASLTFTFNSCNKKTVDARSLKDSSELFLTHIDTNRIGGVQPMFRSATGSRTYLNKGVDGGVWATSANPGDTLIIQSKQNPFTWGFFGNGLTGDSLHPIVVAADGQLNFSVGLSVINGHYIKFISLDTIKNPFAFKINAHVATDTQPGPAGISIEGKSDHLEFANFWIDSTQYGIWCKNEHFCDSSLSNWVLNYMTFRNFKMTNLRQHGSYIGATEIENVTRPSMCNGTNTFLTPSRIGNVRIFNGYIHNVGKNGLMISDARVGMSEIFNVEIDSTGNQLDMAQGHGIASGGATSIYIHDNTIKNTWLAGIASWGGASVRITNNIIYKTGYNVLNNRYSGWTESIRLAFDKQVPFAASFHVDHNQIDETSSGFKDIGVYAGNYTDKNVICQNTNIDKAASSLNVASSVTYTTECDVAPPITPVPCPCPPKPPIDIDIFIVIHVYSDGTTSTAKAVNKKKTLITNVTVYKDGSISK